MKKTITRIIIKALFGFALFVISIVGLYFLTFNTGAWKKYPNPLKTQIAFVKLEMSSCIIDCNNDCISNRVILKEVIVDYLIKKPVATDRQIKDYIFNKDVSNNFKKNLLAVLGESDDDKIPDYLKEYLESRDGNFEVKKEIMNIFGEQIGLNSLFLDNLVRVIKGDNFSSSERVEAMIGLNKIIGVEEADSLLKAGGPFPLYRNIKYNDICETLLNIVEKDNSDEVRYGAIKSLYYCIKFERYYTKEIFNRFEILLNQEGISDDMSSELNLLTTLYKK